MTSLSGTVTPGGPGRTPTVAAVRLLPATPGLTEVEAWTPTGGQRLPFLLSEPAEVTLAGCLASTAQFIDEICTRLLALWEERRSQPDLLRQPRDQWVARAGPAAVFVGYAPDPALSQDSPTADVSDEMATRIQAAALMARGSHIWIDQRG